jgi:hypothetical protein
VRGGVERERERASERQGTCVLRRREGELGDELGAKFRGGDLFRFGHYTISLFQNWTLKLQEK